MYAFYGGKRQRGELLFQIGQVEGLLMYIVYNEDGNKFSEAAYYILSMIM